MGINLFNKKASAPNIFQAVDQMTTGHPLQLSTDKIEFNYSPGKKKISSFLTLTNTADYAVAYKIKTTTQPRYAVKPSLGKIDPKKDAHVTIMFWTTEIGDITSIKDKFQIQVIAVANDLDSADVQNAFRADPGKVANITLPVHVLNENNEQLNARDLGRSDTGLSRGPTQPQREAQQEIFQSSLGVPNSGSPITSNMPAGSTLSMNMNTVPSRGSQLAEDTSAKDGEITRLKEENNKLEQQLSNLRGQNNSGGAVKTGGKFQLWHIITAMIFAMIIGSFLSSGSGAVPVESGL